MLPRPHHVTGWLPTLACLACLAASALAVRPGAAAAAEEEEPTLEAAPVPASEEAPALDEEAALNAEIEEQRPLLYAEGRWPDWMWDQDRPRPWFLHGQIGYAWFNPDDGAAARQGAAFRAAWGYSFDGHWRLGMRLGFSVYQGDQSQSRKGLYTQGSVAALGDYHFSTPVEWCEPSLSFGLGWLRTQRDIETKTAYATHSLLLQPGAGVDFRVATGWWLGLHTLFDVAAFGRQAVAGSVANSWLFTFEHRL